MSTSIENRQITDRPRVAGTPVHAPHAKPVAKPQQASAVERIESSTSYEAVLSEAYDRDNSEAMAVVQNGRRTGDKLGEPEHRLAVPQQKQEGSQGARPIPALKEEKEPADVLTELRRKGKSTAVADNQRVGAGGGLSVKSRHDQLMLAASQMDHAEAARHVTFSAFMTLVDILSRARWKREPAGENDLMRSQMAMMKGRAA